ncbi:hypothetical protein TOPH_01163, partial [Tolypocladium ophioglossoides CBS 100239]
FGPWIRNHIRRHPRDLASAPTTDTSYYPRPCCLAPNRPIFRAPYPWSLDLVTPTALTNYHSSSSPLSSSPHAFSRRNTEHLPVSHAPSQLETKYPPLLLPAEAQWCLSSCSGIHLAHQVSMHIDRFPSHRAPAGSFRVETQECFSLGHVWCRPPTKWMVDVNQQSLSVDWACQAWLLSTTWYSLQCMHSRGNEIVVVSRPKLPRVA